MQLERSPGSFDDLHCRKCFSLNNSLAEGLPNSPCGHCLHLSHSSLHHPHQQEASSHQLTPNEAPSQALSPCAVLHWGTQGTMDSSAAICLPYTKRNTSHTQIWLNVHPCQADPFQEPQKDLSFISEQSTKAGRDRRLPLAPSMYL